ncbi:MAG: hypothetical protein QW416_02025 [Candidatus Nitrosocaldaceae archaeon]
MSIIDINKNDIIKYLIRKSVLTEKQISIIYNRKKGIKVSNQSKGAYYRVLQQGKQNIERVFYSIILLEILNIIDDRKINTLKTLSNNLEKACDINNINIRDVINIVDNILDNLVNE